MKGFFDWLLEQIGDGMLITATLAILNKIAKGWLEAYWPQNEEEKGDENGTESKSESGSRGSSPDWEVNDTNLIKRTADSCASVLLFILDKAETDKMLISFYDEDIAAFVYHKSLIEECLEKDFIPYSHIFTFRSYLDKINHIVIVKRMSRPLVVSLMEQCKEITEILDGMLA